MSVTSTEAIKDAVLGGKVKLLQPPSGYRVAIDPVLLAAAVAAKTGDRILDLGCGVGTAMLCVAARVEATRPVGLEIQEDLAALARRNLTLNGMEERGEILTGDVAAPPAALSADSFQHVIINPPYLESERARPSPDATRAAATVEGEARLDVWVSTAIRFCAPKGSVTFIHRADRLGDLLGCMGVGLGGLKVFPLWPGLGKAARRVIVQGRKGSAAPLEMLPGLVLHGANGAFTPEAEAVLRAVQPIPM
jgi:tRNA1(Val) A37 N6-methylase TrmN6